MAYLDQKQNMVLGSRPSRTQTMGRLVEPDQPPQSTRLGRAIGVGVLALLASGCALRAAQQAPEFPAQQAYQEELAARYVDGLPPGSGATAESRNQVVDDLVYLCNVVFRDYETDLYSSGAAFDTATDLLSMAGAAVGAATGGAAAQAASATVAGLLGARTSVSKNYYLEKSRLALLAKADAMRTAKLAEIKELEQEPIEVWPLSAAMLDVQAYYESGTLLSALKAVTEQAGTELNAAKAKLAHSRPSP